MKTASLLYSPLTRSDIPRSFRLFFRAKNSFVKSLRINVYGDLGQLMAMRRLKCTPFTGVISSFIGFLGAICCSSCSNPVSPSYLFPRSFLDKKKGGEASGFVESRSLINALIASVVPIFRVKAY